MAFETRDPFLIRQVHETADNLLNLKAIILLCPYAWPLLVTALVIKCEQERENPTLSEWDRFAHREYIRLSMEEDVEDASNGSAEVWDESLEAPF